MKRIGLVIPEIADPLDFELLRGIYSQAAALEADVIVLSGVLNPSADDLFDSYTAGFSNIYQLICTANVDGFLFAANRFRDAQVREQIFSLFEQTKTPFLVLDHVREGVPCIIAEQHDGAYLMTKHLIEEHGCKKLWCIAGFPDDPPSLERLRGFTDAMQDAGLPIEKDTIHFGNYWRDIPEQLAREIAAGTYEIPDGVAAMSDAMAIYFGQELQRCGIDVPGRVKITGFDGMWYSAMHDPIITTVCGRELQLGETAVCRLFEMIWGTPVKPLGAVQSIRCGTSCGCGFEKFGGQRELMHTLQRQVAKQLFRGFEKRSHLSADVISQMADADSLDRLTHVIEQSTYLLNGWKRLTIALCEDWCTDFENPYAIRQQGFSEQMLRLLSQTKDGSTVMGGSFASADLLPELYEPHPPMLFVMTSLHCKGQIFGLCVQGLDDPDTLELDDYFVNWTDAVSSALHSLQKRLYVKYQHEQMEAFSTVDAVTELPNKRGFIEQLPDLLHRLRKTDTAYSLLLFSWMESRPEAVFDAAVVIGNALKHSEIPLCGRLSNKVFALVLTDGLDAGTCLAQIREALTQAIGNPALVPDFISRDVPIPGKKPAELEKTVEQAYTEFLQKRDAEIAHCAVYREQLYKLRRDMTSHPEREWSITLISHELGISKTHLQRLYKEQFAAAIKDDLITIRMEHAIQLLLHTDMRVQEIAEQCGYNNSNHFMRQFKEKHGMTALQYRRQHQK